MYIYSIKRRHICDYTAQCEFLAREMVSHLANTMTQGPPERTDRASDQAGSSTHACSHRQARMHQVILQIQQLTQ